MNFRDIAKEAGVSIATVSRVYNGKPGVGDTARRRIEDLLAKNNYSGENRSADIAKRKGNKLEIITFVFYESEGSKSERNEDYFARVLLGAEERAKELGYILSIVSVKTNGFEKFITGSKEVKLSKGMVILATELAKDKYHLLEKCRIPVVAIDNDMKYCSCNTICADNEYGTYKAIEYLKNLGHEKIGLLAPLYPMGGLPAREKSFYEAMQNMGLKTDGRFVIRLDHAVKAGIEEMCEYLKGSPELPTAFYATNDAIGVAAMTALKRYGYSVPEDISIVGFDDAKIGNSSDPRMTTMRINCEDIGRYSVDRLSELIGGDESVMHIYMETPLRIRGTTSNINNKNE